MADQMTFKRYELKYLMTKEQRATILKAMEPYMNPDPHGKSTVQSLYFDTPDFLLVRQSIEKPEYKEKLRLRSYGVATPDTEVFMELKKKYDSVVYKRRESMTETAAKEYIRTHRSPADSQIYREISYALDTYESLEPAVLLSYDRQAFYAKDDHEFRITFDENILWRDYDVDLTKGIYGTPVIEDDLTLMEIKVACAIPLWLVRLLNDCGIRRTSFSKYGNAYQAILARDAGITDYAPVSLTNPAKQNLLLRRTPLAHHKHETNCSKGLYTNLGGTYNYA